VPLLGRPVVADVFGILKSSAFNNDNRCLYASLEPVFQVIESGRDGENLEKLSMETTVLNVHYVIHIIGFHVTLIYALMRPD